MRKRSTIVAVSLAAMCFAYLIGFASARRQWFPYAYVKAAVDIVRAPDSDTKDVSSQSPRTRTITTTFLRLRIDRLAAPVVEPGGALTSFNDELLLLSRRGAIFRLGQDDYVETRIATPDNGLTAYEAAAASARYRHLSHNPGKLRYNDILYYRDGSSHGLVISYTEWRDAEACYQSTIARLRLSPDVVSAVDIASAAEDWQIVHRTQPCLPVKQTMRALEGHIAGGRMAYRAGGRLVVSVGDYHWDGVYAPTILAQSRDNDYGKILEIELDSGRARIVSIGNRNAQGLIIDARDRIWVTEHGPRGGDELNLIRENGNYGWPETKLGTRYSGLPWPGTGAYGRHDLYDAPVYAWVPSVGISPLIRIEGFHPSWAGDLLAGSLSGATLYRLRMRDERVVFSEPIRIGRRIRDIQQHDDGMIYLWTDESVLLRLSPADDSMAMVGIDKLVASSPYEESFRGKLSAALDACAQCHSFERDDEIEALSPIGAPELGAVHGRDVASTKYAGYSPALAEAGGRWTSERLVAYLTDPQSFAPGTSMPDPQLADRALTEALVGILASLDTLAE